MPVPPALANLLKPDDSRMDRLGQVREPRAAGLREVPSTTAFWLSPDRLSTEFSIQSGRLRSIGEKATANRTSSSSSPSSENFKLSQNQDEG